MSPFPTIVDYGDIFLCRGVIAEFFSARQANQWAYFSAPSPGWDRVNMFDNLGKASALSA